MRVSPCPCCNGAGHHPAGPCLYCAGDGMVNEHTWVHFCPNADAPPPPAPSVRRTGRSGQTTAGDPPQAGAARGDEFLADANALLGAARAGDDRIRALRDRYDAEFVPLVREVADGLTEKEVARLHIPVELLREQRAQIERLRALWAVARAAMAEARLIDASDADEP